MKLKTTWLVMLMLLTAVAGGAFGLKSTRLDSRISTNEEATVLSRNSESAAAEGSQLATQTEESSGKVLLLTIRPSGITPREITVPAGSYLLVVRNRSGLDEFSFRLERASGEVLHEGQPRRFQRDWKQVLQLTPGNYLIKETNHPEWMSRITVTAR